MVNTNNKLIKYKSESWLDKTHAKYTNAKAIVFNGTVHKLH